MRNVRTWSTHTVELGDVLARMNKMLRRARRFLIGATVYSVLECPTFAVCLWVVHLEPHLLDNMGPLTRDTAVCRGVSLSEVYPLLLSDWHATPRTGSVYRIVQRGDVRSFYVIAEGRSRKTHLHFTLPYANRVLSVSFSLFILRSSYRDFL